MGSIPTTGLASHHYKGFIMSTIQAELNVFNNLKDVVTKANSLDLTKDYYYYVGYLKGLADGGMTNYSEVDEYVRHELAALYTELDHLENEQSPAGQN